MGGESEKGLEREVKLEIFTAPTEKGHTDSSPSLPAPIYPSMRDCCCVCSSKGGTRVLLGCSMLNGEEGAGWEMGNGVL